MTSLTKWWKNGHFIAKIGYNTTLGHPISTNNTIRNFRVSLIQRTSLFWNFKSSKIQLCKGPPFEIFHKVKTHFSYPTKFYLQPAWSRLFLVAPHRESVDLEPKGNIVNTPENSVCDKNLFWQNWKIFTEIWLGKNGAYAPIFGHF